MRVAVAGFQHESNTFLDGVTPASAFEKGSIYGPLLRGQDVLMLAATGNPVPLAGFLRQCDRRGWTALPVLWCFGEPGARVEGAGFEAIVDEIVERIEALGQFDAIYLDLHGALVAEGFDDGEGELVSRLRRRFGDDMPIVVSLDLHGNVTDRMVEAASVLVAYRTYPHIDMAETGERAAAGLAAIRERGAMQSRHVKLPFLIPIHKQTTFAEPMRGVYDRLAELEKVNSGVESLSFLPGFPLSDIAECGPSVLCYGYDEGAVHEASRSLADMIQRQIDAFDAGLPDAAEAVRQATAWSGPRPVVLADVQDNAGGGGTSDTTWLMRALIEADAKAALGMLFDATSAAQAARAGVGAIVEFELGGRLTGEDSPLRQVFEVVALADEPFRLSGPMAGGAVANLGQMARLRHGQVEVVVVSERTQCHDLEFFRRVGIEPSQIDIVAVKSTNHYRAAFEPIAGTIIEAGCPGACVMDPATLPYRRLRPGVRLRADTLS